MAIFLEKRRKLMKNIYRAFGVTTVSLVFQACYGMPMDMGDDVVIRGTVKSGYTGAPIQGIRVSVKDLPYHNQFTDTNGNFHIFAPRQDLYKLKFEDVDGPYKLKQKELTFANTGGSLSVRLERLDAE